LFDLPSQERADGQGARVRFSFHRKRITPDHFGVNVYCLEGFDPVGIPIRATDGAGMA